MFKNYFKIAVRNLIRHKTFSFINIFGLAVGMACTILIMLWVQDELSFDTFHRNSENIYLVLRGDNTELGASTSKLLAPALKKELPEVEKATCFAQFPESFTCVVRYGNKAFEERIALADSNFFDVFSFTMMEGDPATALKDPSSIVIAEEIARKYFGEKSAAGKLLSVSAFGQSLTMKVSAVMNLIPHNSHIQSKVIFPIAFLKSLGIKDFGWQNQSYQTYIQLSHTLKNAHVIQELSSQIKACELRHDSNQPKSLSYSLLPLTKIHLQSGIKFFRAAGDIMYVRIFIAIAVIILLIAVLNYVNLSTALSMKRTGEVGIRKVVGANRVGLMLQFLGESLLLTVVAVGFALLLAEFFLPEFNVLSGKNISIRYNEPWFISMVFLITIFTSVVSGGYPALFLSSFTPVQMLNGKLKLSSISLFFRKGPVIFQFALSIIIIVCTFIVFNQLSFIRKSNLGFEKENILCVRITGETNSRYDVFKIEIHKNPDILSISRSEPLNGGVLSSTLGVGWPGKPANENTHFWILHSDCDLASTYKIEMSQGRFYSDQYPSDRTNAFVVNEAAVKSMNLKSPLSEEIYVNISGPGRTGRIIGVTKDFHFASFHSAIEPLIFRFPEENEPFFSVISIRFKAGALDNTLKYVEKVWAEQMQGIPLSYYFFDDALNAQYSSEQRMSSIFKYFSILSILLACLGLFGLATFSAQQRTKEVGVRKVLGATIWDVSFILSKEYLKWVVFSNLLAWPVAYYIMHTWLQDFAYRIDLTILPFLLAGVSALVIALLTVSWQAIRAAMANPVEALRYE